MKYIIIAVAMFILVGGITLFFLKQSSTYVAPESSTPLKEENVVSDTPTSTDEKLMAEEEMTTERPGEETIGRSSGGYDIKAYHFGNGEDELLFIGGIHGGYSPNTTLVAFEMIDYLKGNPDQIPDNVTVTVIPVLNPDGLKLVTGSVGRFSPSDISTIEATKIKGRFNAKNVDLNRNFDCQWQSEGVWQSRTVSGGNTPFSEPEAAAIRDYIKAHKLAAAVVWYSAAGGVYASSCNNGILPRTNSLLSTYAKAADYPAFDSFNFYAITGDMVNWFAKENIPAISVLLSDHTNTEWEKNKAGIIATINSFSQ